MQMLEKEARSKYCGPYRSQRRFDDHDGVSDYCNGSNCMMWRWLHTHRAAKNMNPHAPASPRKAELIPVDERLGYCGLAGRPTDEPY